MSYLSPTRLQFAGQFQAAPSTVNNDPVHYDNSTFKKSYQEYGSGATNGWWNPQGDASFRLINCPLTSVVIDGKECAPPSLFVAGSDTRVSGKIVDLDPEQQLVSEIWGQEIRITNKGGDTLLSGKFKVAPFTNIWWSRAASAGGGDISASAVYQSTIEELQWGDFSSEEAESLAQFRAKAGDQLSIRFIVDSYNMDHTSPEFTYGRISGSIGLSSPDGPSHFTLGRHFFPKLNRQGSPQGPLFFACGKLYQDLGRFVLDLGNSLPVSSTNGPIADVGSLYLAYLNQSNEVTILAPVPYSTEAGWYEKTSGIIDIPLSSEQITAAGDTPLMLVGNTQTDPQANPSLLSETPGGYHVRADLFVARLASEDIAEEARFEPKSLPANQANIRLYATQFGEALKGATVFLRFDNSGLQVSTSVQGRTAPVVGTPQSALNFPHTVTTNEEGFVDVTFTASDPGNVRTYMESQIYGVRYYLSQLLDSDYINENSINPSDFLSFLVWQKFEGQADWPSIQPIMQQYANLYPLMDQFIDLSSETDLLTQRDALLLVFGLDPSNPNYMPVTRDLSPAKRQAILTWLNNNESTPRSDGESNRTPKAAAPPEKLAATTPESAEPLRGGKTLAGMRRLGQLRYQTKQH